jgi:hypothetical protein
MQRALCRAQFFFDRHRALTGGALDFGHFRALVLGEIQSGETTTESATGPLRAEAIAASASAPRLLTGLLIGSGAACRAVSLCRHE